MVRHLLSHAL